MRIKINVTQEHIDKGIRGNTKYCPIARAVKQEGFTDVDVDGETVDWADKCGNYFSVTLPPIAEQFVHDFDDKMEVKPISFTLTFKKPD
jgi:hypothetical protein